MLRLSLRPNELEVLRCNGNVEEILNYIKKNNLCIQAGSTDNMQYLRSG